jgi:TatD DNase family protein
VFDAHRDIGGVVHSFSKDEATMRACVEHGLSVGINGIITFAKDPDFETAVQKLPLEYMVLETDAPFLTLHPYRGKINYSAYIGTIVEFISNLREESAEEIANKTTKNARRLFSL